MVETSKGTACRATTSNLSFVEMVFYIFTLVGNADNFNTNF
ncbi:hypothetical protein BMS3Abin09_01207 [bacterium BMS3Abin09]|nr:hypothetical protein BMS3Abin09_01207 [bacterium BMS3Abin09]